MGTPLLVLEEEGARIPVQWKQILDRQRSPIVNIFLEILSRYNWRGRKNPRSD